MTNANVIEMNEVTKAFDRVTALNRCSLKVKRGEIFGYLGPSGAGKTTTLKPADRAAPQRRRRDGGAGGEPLLSENEAAHRHHERYERSL